MGGHIVKLFIGNSLDRLRGRMAGASLLAQTFALPNNFSSRNGTAAQ